MDYIILGREQKAGIVARWKPVHLGHAIVLKHMCGIFQHVLIGIGSSNRYNVRNPFSASETEKMISLVLGEYTNYNIVPVPDLDNGPLWKEQVSRIFEGIDIFSTGNPYVASLLEDVFAIVHPTRFLLPEELLPVSGSLVRHEMAKGCNWQALVPSQIAEYISTNGLDIRFRNEFGLECLAYETVVNSF